MTKESMTGKSLIAAGAAVAFAGATLYAVGQTLNFLFRDVNPDRIEKVEEEPDAPGAEETVEETTI